MSHTKSGHQTNQTTKVVTKIALTYLPECLGMTVLESGATTLVTKTMMMGTFVPSANMCPSALKLRSDLLNIIKIVGPLAAIRNTHTEVSSRQRNQSTQLYFSKVVQIIFDNQIKTKKAKAKTK